MQINQTLSFQTQHDLAKLFECVIIGMSRIHKCFQYLQSLSYAHKSEFLFAMLSQGSSAIQWQRIADFLGFHRVDITREQAVGLLLIMGGNVECITKEEFFVYLRSRDDCENIYEGVHKHQLEIKNEIEMTFVKILEEELLLEKNADQIRFKVENRWDYQDQALFKAVVRGKMDQTIDYLKFKQYFTRLRYPITDEELYHLIRRFGNNGQVTYQNFQRVAMTLTDRVRNATDEWGGIKVRSRNTSAIKKPPKMLTESNFSSKNVRYFERLKKKYLQNSFSQQLQNMNKPKRATSTHQSGQQVSNDSRGRSTSFNQVPQFGQLAKSAIFHKQISLKDVVQEIDGVKERESYIKSMYNTPEKPLYPSNQNQAETIPRIRVDLLSTPSKQNNSQYSTAQKKQQPANQLNTPPKENDQTFKKLNQLVAPLFPLMKSMVQNIEEIQKVFKQLPEIVILQLRQLGDLPDFAQQWKVLGIDTHEVTQKEMLQIINTYQPGKNQTYETINLLNKLDKSTILFAQKLFDTINKSKQTLRQAKLSFFNSKTSSFIQLFEELDSASKGHMEINDLKNLLNNANVTYSDQNVLGILFKQLNHNENTNTLSFNSFLKELTP